MKVAKDLVVSLAYQVRTEDGVLVDESPVSAPLDYLHGHGSLIAGLEKALEGHEAGDRGECEHHEHERDRRSPSEFVGQRVTGCRPDVDLLGQRRLVLVQNALFLAVLLDDIINTAVSQI